MGPLNLILDGFAKSPSAALRYIPRRYSVTMEIVHRSLFTVHRKYIIC